MQWASRKGKLNVSGRVFPLTDKAKTDLPYFTTYCSGAEESKERERERRTGSESSRICQYHLLQKLHNLFNRALRSGTATCAPRRVKATHSHSCCSPLFVRFDFGSKWGVFFRVRLKVKRQQRPATPPPATPPTFSLRPFEENTLLVLWNVCLDISTIRFLSKKDLILSCFPLTKIVKRRL